MMLSFMLNYLKFSFQEASSMQMFKMLFFYDIVMLAIIFIVLVSLIQVGALLLNKNLNSMFLENNYLEFMWTLAPLIILMFISAPSLFVLYMLDLSYKDKLVTLKVMGNQWYWSYEYSDVYDVKFDSYMLKNSNLRNMDVDMRAVVPMNTPLRLLISSSDVLHSFALPSLGLKIDAIPGRLNQMVLSVKKSGLFYGQCSEICGINHSFMPIMIESINFYNFLKWLNFMNNNF